uniref:Uncharacterized protein n=1 Tax=Anguilla anguilla TaxID=7936 RepID=A0A0E9VTS3_ANGAN
MKRRKHRLPILFRFYRHLVQNSPRANLRPILGKLL